jgi:hypothetical protein
MKQILPLKQAVDSTFSNLTSPDANSHHSKNLFHSASITAAFSAIMYLNWHPVRQTLEPCRVDTSYHVVAQTGKSVPMLVNVIIFPEDII